MKFQQNSNSAEGLLDVILALTLIFMLISSLANDPGSKKRQELQLPDIKLSKEKMNGEELGRSFKHTLSMSLQNDELKYFLNEKQLNFTALKKEIQKHSILRVALRRDKDLTCAAVDKVIAMLRNENVIEIAFVIEGEVS